MGTVRPLLSHLVILTASRALVIGTSPDRRLAIVCCEEIDEETYTWVRCLRSEASDAILVFFSRGQPDRTTQLYEAGATECLPLGFSLAHLMSRLQSLIRPEAAGTPVRLTDCGLMVGSRVFRLTPAEYRIMQVLWEAAGQIVRYARLEQALYQGSGPCERQAVRQIIYRLRGRLGAFGRLIETVPGFGYRLRLDLVEADLLSACDGPVMAS